MLWWSSYFIFSKGKALLLISGFICLGMLKEEAEVPDKGTELGEKVAHGENGQFASVSVAKGQDEDLVGHELKICNSSTC